MMTITLYDLWCFIGSMNNDYKIIRSCFIGSRNDDYKIIQYLLFYSKYE